MRYATLTVSGGRPTLAHWLSRGRTVTEKIARKLDTTLMFKEQADATLRLAEVLEARHGVQVFWEEANQQKRRCPECSPELKKHAQWHFNYPEMPAGEFEQLLKSLEISLATVASEGNGFHVLEYTQQQPRTYIHMFEQDERYWLAVFPKERSYRQSHDILEQNGEEMPARTILYHVYTKKTIAWMLAQEHEHTQNLRRPVTDITWGFRRVQEGQKSPSWRMYAARMVTQ
jgi:hypothetical protein